jgi:uncharacterized protein (DUF362 family)
MSPVSRRELLRGAAATGAFLAATPLVARAAPSSARVVVVRTTDRARAVAAALEALDFTACAGRPVAVKANFNSDDAFPASTHPATLAALLGELRARGATELTVAERSGMGDTRRVLQRTGAADVVARAGGATSVLDDAPADAWRPFTADHWPNGLRGARIFTDGVCAVQTMCCKTHRFGGHVTLALKNTVGLVARRVPGDGHDFMRDLHRSPHQRAMIAEANLAWRPAVSVMDCLEASSTAVPSRGPARRPACSWPARIVVPSTPRPSRCCACTACRARPGAARSVAPSSSRVRWSSASGRPRPR